MFWLLRVSSRCRDELLLVIIPPSLRFKHPGRGCWNLSQHALGEATAINSLGSNFDNGEGEGGKKQAYSPNPRAKDDGRRRGREKKKKREAPLASEKLIQIPQPHIKGKLSGRKVNARQEKRSVSGKIRWQRAITRAKLVSDTETMTR